MYIDYIWIQKVKFQFSKYYLSNHNVVKVAGLKEHMAHTKLFKGRHRSKCCSVHNGVKFFEKGIRGIQIYV